MGSAGQPDHPGFHPVTITLQPEGTKTRLTFVHSGLPDAQAVIDHTKGWDHYLERLAIVAAGGTVPARRPVRRLAAASVGAVDRFRGGGLGQEPVRPRR